MDTLRNLYFTLLFSKTYFSLVSYFHYVISKLFLTLSYSKFVDDSYLLHRPQEHWRSHSSGTAGAPRHTTLGVSLGGPSVRPSEARVIQGQA
jgi:hypothetical protein